MAIGIIAESFLLFKFIESVRFDIFDAVVWARQLFSIIILGIGIVAAALYIFRPVLLAKIINKIREALPFIHHHAKRNYTILHTHSLSWIEKFKTGSRRTKILMVGKPLILIFAVVLFLQTKNNFIPPKITASFPDDKSTEAPLDTDIEIIFDRPMIRQTVERNLVIKPAVEGEYSWENNQKIIFRPKKNLDRATIYEASLKGTVLSQFFVPLISSKKISFETIGNPKVVLTSPAAEALEDLAPITVMFDRAMIPLTTATNSAVKKAAFTVSPKIEGNGRWLGTTAYQFRPTARFRLATTYTATLIPGQISQDGGALPDGFSWSFSSERPRIDATTPIDGEIFASPTASVAAIFNQEIDPKSVEGHFRVRANDASEVPGTLKIVGKIVAFHPQQPLKREKSYTAIIDSGIKSIEGPNGSELGRDWTFQIAPFPQIISTDPANGEQNIDEQHTIEVYFKSPMDNDSFDNNIIIDPAPSRKPSTYFSDYQGKHILNINTYLGRSATYTITIGANVKDQHGTPLGKPYKFSFVTAPYKPSVAIYPSGTYFGSFNQNITPRIVVQTVNTNKISYTLYKLKEEDLMHLYDRRYGSYCSGKGTTCWNWQDYDPSSLEKVNNWEENYSPDLNTPIHVVTKVNQRNGDRIPSGFYYLDVRIPQGPHDNMAMIVSKSTLTVKKSEGQIFAWAVDQSSGNVVPNMRLRLAMLSKETLAEGDTNNDGVFIKNVDLYNKSNLFMWGKKDDDVVVATEAWSEGINRYDFGLPYHYNPQEQQYYQTKEQFKFYLTLDRPIYRPGQKVYFKGVVRKDNDSAYENIAAGEKADVVITDSENRTVYSTTHDLSSFGSFYGDFTLGKDANLGYYQLKATVQGNSYSQQFQVEEYRKPEISMSVKTAAANYSQGEKAEIDVEASYYFGAPVTQAPVGWTIQTSDYNFSWSKDVRFEFGDSDDYWYRPWWYFSDSYSFGELVTQGKGITDAKGNLTVYQPLDISKYKSDQIMTVEATVTDASNQAIAASQQFVVRKSDMRAGIKAKQYVNKAGEEAKVEVVALNKSDKETGNQKISLTFYKRTWETVREKNPDDGIFYYVSKPHDTMVSKTEVTTDNLGRAAGSFVPAEGGVYKAVAEINDSAGRSSRSGTYLWVSGSGGSFPRENNDRITIVTDKDSYTVGDTASIFVASPYASSSAKTLLTAERGSVLDYKIVDTSSSSNNFPMEIKSQFSPNAFLSAILIKPAVDLANPSEFKIGYAEVQVTDSKTKIDVSIQTDKTRYKPGEHMKLTVATKDLLGHPVSSEVAVGLIDKAVWDLAQVQIPGIFETYYQPRNLGVDTSQLLTISIDRINANTNLGAKGGSGGGCFTGDTPVIMGDGMEKPIEKIKVGDIILTRKSETAADLLPAKVLQVFKHKVEDYLIINGELKVTSIHRMFVNGSWLIAGLIRKGDILLTADNKKITVFSIEYVKGDFTVYNLETETYHTYFAGGFYVHNQKGSMDTTRRDFPDTAYWNPKLETGKDGQASLDIKLPDSLTTWRIAAIASDNKAAFGSQTANVIVSRDILIRPFLPRFLQIGDKANLGAIIVNTSGDTQTLTASIKSEGLELSGDPQQTFTLADGAQKKITWSTNTKPVKEAKIHLAVKGEDGAEKDSMEVSLPIKKYGIPETVAVAGEAKNTAQENILLPKEIDSTQGSAEFSLAPALGTAGFNGFPYLQEYMYYCTEQTTSRLLPAVYMYRIMKSAGIEKTGIVEISQLEAAISFSVQKLQNEQHDDGGWGWWVNEPTDEYLTAYAYMALKEAKNNKLAVSDDTLNRARNYLKNTLGYGSVSSPTRIFVMYALRGENISLSSYASKLFERRFELPIESRAYLAVILGDSQSTKTLSKRLMDEVISLGKKTNTTTHWEEARGHHWYWYIGSNTITNAAVMEMLAQLDKNNPLLTEVIRYLMSTRTDTHWETTRDTAAVIKAIAIRLIAKGDEKVSETYRIKLNDKILKEAGFSKNDLLGLHTYTVGINSLKIGANNNVQFTKTGTGNLYYNINLKYYLPYNEIKPLEQGMVVVRELIDEKGNLLPQDHIAEGAEAWMRLIIAVPEERHYVAVEDMLPAGLEAVNESLKNVSTLNKERPPLKDKDNRDYYFSQREYHDDRTTLFARYLPPGVYEIAYRVRATTPGKYHHPPANAYQMYIPDISGHSDGGWFEVK